MIVEVNRLSSSPFSPLPSSASFERQTGSRLFTLPGEIRNVIYSYLLVDKIDLVPEGDICSVIYAYGLIDRTENGLGLLRVCRQLNQEFGSFLRKAQTFTVSCSSEVYNMHSHLKERRITNLTYKLTGFMRVVESLEMLDGDEHNLACNAFSWLMQHVPGLRVIKMIWRMEIAMEKEVEVYVRLIQQRIQALASKPPSEEAVVEEKSNRTGGGWYEMDASWKQAKGWEQVTSREVVVVKLEVRIPKEKP